MFKLSAKSLKKMDGVHPDLVRVAVLAIQLSPYDFTVTEGVRDSVRQALLVAKGASKTLRSKHLIQPDGLGHAIDVMAVGDLDGDGDGDAKDLAKTWDPAIYRAIAGAFKGAAATLGVKIKCGALDWPKFFDGPHIELA